MHSQLATRLIPLGFCLSCLRPTVGQWPVPVVRAAAAANPAIPDGELTLMVRQLERGDTNAPLARMRERVTKAYDSMMVRLERGHAAQGRAPLQKAKKERRKIDLLAPSPLKGLAHTLRQWSNEAKHQRDQWECPPTDKAVQRLVKKIIAELEVLGW